MKTLFSVLKALLYTILGALGLLILVLLAALMIGKISSSSTLRKARALDKGEVQSLTIDGYTFRDLNKNGTLDIYEDARESVEDRVNDLLSQMTLEEKAGTMFISMMGLKKDGSLVEGISLRNPLVSTGSSEMVFMKQMNHFNILAAAGKQQMAEWYNNLQKLAERTRLGIPVTIATDPRNHYSKNPLMAGMAGDMSQFPEPIGLASMNDSSAVAEFADIARQEYLAVGIRVALHPQIDLATEPRWGRITGTFGEDADLTSKLAAAYIKGFQGDSIGPFSVACMTKHWPGGGPQEKGVDAHFESGAAQVYPGNNFEYHLRPFEAAFEAGTAMIMPYYGIPVGQTGEEVGMGFNREIIQGLLRDDYGFEGIVCTDWSLVSGNRFIGIKILGARDWGMQDATPEEHVQRIIDAGVDQFGGESCPELVVKLVNEGKIPEARIDRSVSRILKMKFEMGLFDNPYIDVDNAIRVVGNERFKAVAELAHRKSIVLLKNDTLNGRPVLPLAKGIKIYIENIDEEVAAEYGTVVKKPEEADIAIIRLKSASEKMKGGGVIGRLFASGDLDFKGKEKEKILDLLSEVPTIVDITLERPVVIPEITEASRGLFGNFSSKDEALLDVIFGDFIPQGRLPFELPSSMEAVENQLEDVPYDSKDPLFPFGYGLSY